MGTGMSHQSVIVLGIGNEFRGDDSIGLRIVRALRDIGLPNVTVLESSGNGTSLMEAWKGFDVVLVVDAVSAEALPGSIFRIDLHHHRISSQLLSSTHNFGLAEAVELARAWGELPRTMILYGVQVSDVIQGAEPTSRILRAAGEVVAMIRQDVDSLGSFSGTPMPLRSS